MDKNYILKSGKRIAHLSRLIAKVIDLFIVVILSMFLYPLGILLGAFYLAIGDSLQEGQSVGKKFIGFKVVSLEDGRSCSFKQSVIRNLPFLIPLIFAIVPLWGWVVAFILSIPLISLELYLMFKLDSGHRLGDVMADTSVIADDFHRADVNKKKDSWFSRKTAVSTKT